jgi:hypothetical protein
MDKLQEYFQQFQKIQHSYEGEKTDWEKRHLELKCLYDDISHFRLQNSKNVIYYEWIQRKLKNEICNEIDRVYKLKERM